MKTKPLSKLVSKFLFFALGLLTFWGRAKESWAGSQNGWQMPKEAPGGIPMDFETATVIFIKTFILSPLIVIGLLFYASALFYGLKKKDLKKAHRMFMRGTIILVSLLIIYIFVSIATAWLLSE